jgi:phosphoserine phosphatase
MKRLSPSPCPQTSPWLGHTGWLPEVRAGLHEMLRWRPESGEPPVAALDFDQTCLSGDVSETSLVLLAEDRGEPLVEAYERDCRIDMRRAYIELVSTLVAGLTEVEARQLALRALREGGCRGRLSHREEMRELVWALQRHGWEIYVVTASAEVLVQALAEQMGIPPNQVFGMRSPLTPEGRYGQGVLEPVPYREGKLEVIRQAAGRDPDFASGDSRSDAAMMAAARFALLWDHGDAALRAEAQERGIWIQQGRPGEEKR